MATHVVYKQAAHARVYTYRQSRFSAVTVYVRITVESDIAVKSHECIELLRMHACTYLGQLWCLCQG